MTTEHVSIEDAINLANRKIKWPSIAVMVTPWLAFVIAGKIGLIPTIGYAGMYWFIPAFLGGFLGGWLVWSVRIPKWMLWAYPRVHNLTELKACAIEAQILWPDESVFNRTLIMSAAERQKLREIEHQANEENRT